MAWILIILGILIVGTAIFFWKAHTPGRTDERQHFKKEIQGFVNGQVEPIENYQESFRVLFKSDGQDFIFEDIQEEGLKEKIYKGYLKAPTGIPLTIAFTEKKRLGGVRAEIMIASDLKDDMVSPERVKVPESLREFNIYTNNVNFVNKLFLHKKIVAIFEEFKNQDARGQASLSLKVLDGVVILDFHPMISMHPNIWMLHRSVASIEDHIHKMLEVVEKIKELAQEK